MIDKEILNDIEYCMTKIVENCINSLKNKSYDFDIIDTRYQNAFRYNNIYVDVFRNECNTYLNLLEVDRKRLNITNELSKILYKELSRIYINGSKLIRIIHYKRTKQLSTFLELEVINDYKERIEEFDIILNDKIDEINLERLFDFYEIEYTPNVIKLITNE